MFDLELETGVELIILIVSFTSLLYTLFDLELETGVELVILIVSFTSLLYTLFDLELEISVQLLWMFILVHSCYESLNDLRDSLWIIVTISLRWIVFVGSINPLIILISVYY